MKLLRVAVLWGVGLLLVPALAGAQSAEDWYRQGFELSLQENSQAAIQAYRNALDLRPDWAEAHHALGTLLFHSGQGPQAIAQFRMAEREYTRRKDAQAVTNLGIIRRNLKQAYRELGFDPKDFEQIESIPGLPVAPQWRIAGTGFFAGAQGTVLTSNHAVKDAHKIRIRLPDGSTHPARLNRSFIVYDVAVLELQPSGPLSLKRLSLGDSSLVKEGEPVYVLKDLQSADSRKGNLLAVNALESNKVIFHVGIPAGPRDSGGPVFNQKGEVVGLLLTRKDIQNLFRRMKPVPENTSFAIKSDYLRQTLKRVSRSGETTPSGHPLTDSLPALIQVIASGTVTIEVSP
ncbi:MAG: trypsin-like peptidase domain-containing protein [Nitrospinae bacterium]|nr:trypsin-like peptidase domain-containing protein [Nitrospinota bacterium]